MKGKGKILVTGGAGYIGSHVVKLLLEKGFKVAVFDNFSTGFRQPLSLLKKKYRPFKVFYGDLRNYKEISTELKKFKPSLVIHLAARCSVDESMKKPKLYFNNNVRGTANLLKSMKEAKVLKIIFSSTCAVYGTAKKLPIVENHPTKPVNVYGRTKLLAEKLIQRYSKENRLKYIIFRFFNVCGADSKGLIGDSKKPSMLLVQNAVRGAMGIEKFKLTCPKVHTQDGTPIRDYIDVEDLAKTHLLAINYLVKNKNGLVLNLGSGKGYSVKQIISAVEKVLQKISVIRTKPSREYAKIFASNIKAKKDLHFQISKNLSQSILSLQKWYKNKPNGYSY